MTISWESAGATHTGRVRKGNEDSFRVDDANGIFIVADGMGGHAAGEIASALAAETVLDYLGRSADRSTGGAEVAILEAFAAAQRAMILCCEDDPRTRGMGTTLTVALFDPRGVVHVGHLGDSRLYRLQAGELTQMTQDHTWVQQEVESGRLNAEAGRAHPLAHILTRVLSADEPSGPDLLSAEVLPGDTFLLCSDGLHNHFDSRTIEEMLVADAPTPEIVAQLIRTANRRGGTDNITAVVVRVR